MGYRFKKRGGSVGKLGRNNLHITVECNPMGLPAQPEFIDNPNYEKLVLCTDWPHNITLLFMPKEINDYILAENISPMLGAMWQLYFNERVREETE